MPIPEPSRFRVSNLTAKQRREQLAALYGVTVNPELSREEIERMRQIVKQHDAQHKPLQVFDLNNPPKQPYHFQKFPMMVYDLEQSQPGHVVSAIVSSEQELQEAMASGWSNEAPAYGDAREESLSPAYQQEADEVQRRVEEARRRRGRPRNAEVA